MSHQSAPRTSPGSTANTTGNITNSGQYTSIQGGIVNLTIPSNQADHSVGFAGKYSVQTDRKDESAGGFDDKQEKVGTNYNKTKVQPTTGELLNRLRTASKYIAEHLTDAEVTSISSNLYSKDPPCISAMEYEDVKVVKGDIRKATKLLEILEKKSADVIGIFEQILRDEQRPDLANYLVFGKPDEQ